MAVASRGRGRRPEAKQATCGHKPRADAMRNRDLLLEAAKASFAETGAGVSLDEIARRAGVGIGTLYRHFPTRDAIVEAVYRREVEQLADAAIVSPGHCRRARLHAWMRLFVDYITTKRVIAPALKAMVDGAPELYAASRARITDAIGRMVERARAAGEIRADADPADLLRALAGFTHFNAGADWEASARRLIDIMMDGLELGDRIDEFGVPVEPSRLIRVRGLIERLTCHRYPRKHASASVPGVPCDERDPDQTFPSRGPLRAARVLRRSGAQSTSSSGRLDLRPPVYVRHEIVHNRYVVDALKAKGAVFIAELNEAPPGAHPVVFSAHGVARTVLEEASTRKLFVIDATCPLVTKVHREALAHFKHGLHVILIGHAGHPEVIGTIGQLPPGAITLLSTIEDVEGSRRAAATWLT